MNAWSKANGVKNDDILFLSDENGKFSKTIGCIQDSSSRTARYALVIDHGKVVFAAKDQQGQFDVGFTSYHSFLHFWKRERECNLSMICWSVHANLCVSVTIRSLLPNLCSQSCRNLIEIVSTTFFNREKEEYYIILHP
jgi:hypothetical protein